MNIHQIKRIALLFLMLVAISISSRAEERIKMNFESGVYTVPCEVNGLKLRFVFDTGASDVHLSLIEAAFMLKNGYISPDDILGTDSYSMADGSIAENAIVLLKEIKIGHIVINDVRACVSSKIDASLLLGQSAIQKLGKYAIDGSELILFSSTDQEEHADASYADSIMYNDKGNVVSFDYTGKGKKVLYNRDGSIHGYVEGSFKNGEEDGYVKIMNVDDNSWYEGRIVNREASGKGKMFIDNTLYEGDFENGQMHGKGKMTWQNGDVYDGDWVLDNRTGKGTITWSTGHCYKGDFLNNKRTGQGEFVWPNGACYLGGWLDDKREGQGTMKYTDGTYVGSWKNDMRNGYGTFSGNDGSKFTGYYKNDKKDGYGTFVYSNGDQYEGSFKDDNIDGNGTYKWKSGDRYEGNWMKGQRTGYGTYFWKDGSKFQGYWLNGKQNGDGTLFYPNGNKTTGQWQNGEFVKNQLTQTSDNNSTFTTSSNRNTITNTSSSSSADNDGYVDNSYNKVRGYSYENYNEGDEDEDEDEDEYSYESHTSSYTYENVDYYLAQVSIELNLRSGPGTNYSIVSKIPKGSFVFLSTADAGNAFRKVLYIDKNVYGYVSKNYLINFNKVEEDNSGNLQIQSKNYKNTADITIENNTNKTATIAVGDKSYKFSPHQTRTITDIKPGRYKIMASSPGVIPYVTYDNVEAGYIYSWEFYITTIRR